MTDGVVLIPYEFYIILGLLFSMIATQEFVVPKSMPKIGDLFLVEKLKEELFLMRFLIIYNNWVYNAQKGKFKYELDQSFILLSNFFIY